MSGLLFGPQKSGRNNGVVRRMAGFHCTRAVKYANFSQQCNKKLSQLWKQTFLSHHSNFCFVFHILLSPFSWGWKENQINIQYLNGNYGWIIVLLNEILKMDERFSAVLTWNSRSSLSGHSCKWTALLTNLNQFELPYKLCIILHIPISSRRHFRGVQNWIRHFFLRVPQLTGTLTVFIYVPFILLCYM